MTSKGPPQVQDHAPSSPHKEKPDDEISSYANTAIQEMLGWYGLQDQNDARSSTPSPHAQPPHQTEGCSTASPTPGTQGSEREPRISPGLNPTDQLFRQTLESSQEELLNGPVSPGCDLRGSNRKLIGMRYMFPPLGDHLSLLDKARIWVARHDYKYFVGWSEEQLQTVDPLLRPVGVITHDMYKLHMNRSEYCRNVKLKYCLESDSDWAKEFREKLAKPFGKGGFSGLCQAKIAAAELWRRFSENYKSHQARYPNPKSKYRSRKLARDTLTKVRANPGRHMIRTGKITHSVSVPRPAMQGQFGNQTQMLGEENIQPREKDIKVCQVENNNTQHKPDLEKNDLQNSWTGAAMVVQNLEECVTITAPPENLACENSGNNFENEVELQATQSNPENCTGSSSKVISMGNQYVTISHHVVTQVETISGGTVATSSSMSQINAGSLEKGDVNEVCRDKALSTTSVEAGLLTARDDSSSRQGHLDSVIGRSGNPNSTMSHVAGLTGPASSGISMSLKPLVSRPCLTVTASSQQAPILASQVSRPLTVSGTASDDFQVKLPNVSQSTLPTSNLPIRGSPVSPNLGIFTNSSVSTSGEMGPPVSGTSVFTVAGISPSQVKQTGPQLQHQSKSSEYRKCERGLSFLFPSLADQQLTLPEKVDITLMRHKNNYFKNWTNEQLAKIDPVVRPKMIVTPELFKEYCHRNAMKYDSNLQFAIEAKDPWAKEFQDRLHKPPSLGGFSSLCEVKQEAGKLWKMYSGKYKKPHSIKSQMVLNGDVMVKKILPNDEEDNPTRQRMMRQSAGGAIIRCNSVSAEEQLLQSGIGITTTSDLQEESGGETIFPFGISYGCPSPAHSRSPSVSSTGSAASIPMSPVNGQCSPRKRKLSDSSVASFVSVNESNSTDGWRFSKAPKSDFQVPCSEESVGSVYKSGLSGVPFSTKTDFQVPQSPMSEMVASPAQSTSSKDWTPPEITNSPKPVEFSPAGSRQRQGLLQNLPSPHQFSHSDHTEGQVVLKDGRDQHNIDILFKPLSNQLSVAGHVHIWMERYRSNFFRGFSKEMLQDIVPIARPQFLVTDEVYKHYISPDVIHMLEKVDKIMTSQLETWAKQFQERVTKPANEGGYNTVEDALADALQLWKLHYETPGHNLERYGPMSAALPESRHLTASVQQSVVTHQIPVDNSHGQPQREQLTCIPGCQQNEKQTVYTNPSTGRIQLLPDASQPSNLTLPTMSSSENVKYGAMDAPMTQKDHAEFRRLDSSVEQQVNFNRDGSDYHTNRRLSIHQAHGNTSSASLTSEHQTSVRYHTQYDQERTASHSRANGSSYQVLDLSHSGSRSVVEKLWACRDTLHKECWENPSVSWHERLTPFLPLLEEKLGPDYAMPALGAGCVLDLALCLLHQELKK